jgi:hypothetical protein
MTTARVGQQVHGHVSMALATRHTGRQYVTSSTKQLCRGHVQGDSLQNLVRFAARCVTRGAPGPSVGIYT